MNSTKFPLTALVEDADLSPAEAAHVFDAPKAVIGGNWFVLLSDGQLAGGPVNMDGTLDWGMLTTIDMPDCFEYPELTRRATAMLNAAAAAPDSYEARVRAYEAQGMDRSDAQGVVDAEDMGA